jgi:type III pantothenate kinase
MFLAIDIGNTTSSFGFFSGRKYLDGFKLPSQQAKHEDDLGKLLLSHLQHHLPGKEVIRKIGICSVVPEITHKFMSIAEKYHKVIPEQLRADKEYGFRIGYDEPGQLGTDRLANIIAARELYGFPLIVIDMGTATKIELLNSTGDYAGGMIAPGIAISADALFEKAARLFPVTFSKPKGLIGNNTIDCLKSGIYYGTVGQLKWVIESIKSQYGIQDITVIGTGGLVSVLESEAGLFTKIDPELTLRGLQIALDQ